MLIILGYIHNIIIRSILFRIIGYAFSWDDKTRYHVWECIYNIYFYGMLFVYNSTHVDTNLIKCLYDIIAWSLYNQCYRFITNRVSFIVFIKDIMRILYIYKVLFNIHIIYHTVSLLYMTFIPSILFHIHYISFLSYINFNDDVSRYISNYLNSYRISMTGLYLCLSSLYMINILIDVRYMYIWFRMFMLLLANILYTGKLYDIIEDTW